MRAAACGVSIELKRIASLRVGRLRLARLRRSRSFLLRDLGPENAYPSIIVSQAAVKLLPMDEKYVNLCGLLLPMRREKQSGSGEAAKKTGR